MRALNELRSALKRLPGPLPNFSLIHAVLMLILLEEGAIGRKRLSDLMSIGEGSVRSLIRRLKEAGYLEVDKGGCYLSRKGLRELKELREVLRGPVEVELLELVRGSVQAFILRGIGRRRLDVLELRDEAVRVGGRGAIILLYQGDNLIFPETMEPLEKYQSRDEEILKKSLQPSEGDLIILGLGKTPKESRVAALAVSLSVLQALGSTSYPKQ